MPPPPPPPPNPSLRFRIVRTTTGMRVLPVTIPPAPPIAPPAQPIPRPPLSFNRIPTYDPYHSPGFVPMPTYPWLAHEIGKHERMIQNIEQHIIKYPKHYEMEKVMLDVYHTKHEIQELKTRLSIVAGKKFYGDRISKLEDNVDKMKAQMDAMQYIIRELSKNKK